MSSPLSPWSKEDLAAWAVLDRLLSKNTEWKLSASEVVESYKAFVWFASLRDKIDKSVADDLKLITPEKKELTPSDFE